MNGKQALGAFLIFIGLLLFLSSILARVSTTFAGLVYGEKVLKETGV